MSENEVDILKSEIHYLRSEMEYKMEELVKKLSRVVSEGTDAWLSINDLIEYLPDKTARATIYGWVSHETIPYHKFGKKLTFRKSEIDNWLFEGTNTKKKEKTESTKSIEKFR